MSDIDFLPDRIRAQRARWRRLRLQAGFLLVFGTALAGLGYAFHGRIETAQVELGLLTDRADGLQVELRLRESLEAQLADLTIKKRIEEQLGRRVGTLDVLAEVQRVLPESMALTSMTMETVEVRLPEEAVDRQDPARAAVRKSKGAERIGKRVRLTITGLAPTDVDVANFIGQLSASSVFEDVNMGYAKNLTFRGRDARAFQASCYVVR